MCESRRLERRGHLLMSTVFFEFFLVIKSERGEHRQVLNRKQHGVRAFRSVSVLVQRPRRDGKDVAFPPIEPLAVDDGEAFTLRDVVDRAAGVPMRFGVLARSEQLY